MFSRRSVRHAPRRNFATAKPCRKKCCSNNASTSLEAEDPAGGRVRIQAKPPSEHITRAWAGGGRGYRFNKQSRPLPTEHLRLGRARHSFSFSWGGDRFL